MRAYLDLPAYQHSQSVPNVVKKCSHNFIFFEFPGLRPRILNQWFRWDHCPPIYATYSQANRWCAFRNKTKSKIYTYSLRIFKHFYLKRHYLVFLFVSIQSSLLIPYLILSFSYQIYLVTLRPSQSGNDLLCKVHNPLKRLFGHEKNRQSADYRSRYRFF